MLAHKMLSLQTGRRIHFTDIVELIVRPWIFEHSSCAAAGMMVSRALSSCSAILDFRPMKEQGFKIRRTTKKHTSIRVKQKKLFPQNFRLHTTGEKAQVRCN